MHLASIASQEENDRLEKHIKDFGLGHEHFWTSGTDQGEEGTFFWMANGRPITFENWNVGEPNNFRYYIFFVFMLKLFLFPFPIPLNSHFNFTDIQSQSKLNNCSANVEFNINNFFCAPFFFSRSKNKIGKWIA